MAKENLAFLKEENNQSKQHEAYFILGLKMLPCLTRTVILYPNMYEQTHSQYACVPCLIDKFMHRNTITVKLNKTAEK